MGTNSLYQKEVPKTVYVLANSHEMRTYTQVGSMSAAIATSYGPWELYIFDASGKLTADELTAIYDSIPPKTKKRSEKLAEAFRVKTLLSALRKGDMDG
jgi:hypothetical protein